MSVKSHKSLHLLSLYNYNFAFVSKKRFSCTPDLGFETSINPCTNGRCEDKKTDIYANLPGSGYLSVSDHHFSQSATTTGSSKYHSTIIQIGNH